MIGEIRIVGKRIEPKFSLHASGDALKKAAAFNETLQSVFPYGRMICCPKGVYRFRTQEEANLHQEHYVATTMARISDLNKAKRKYSGND